MSPPGLIRIKRSAEDPPLLALLCERDEDTLYYQLMQHNETNKTACVEPVTLSEALEQIKALPVTMDEVKMEDEITDGFVGLVSVEVAEFGSDEEDSLWEDDEDSNAEDYYQNDYPDEDDNSENSDHWYQGGSANGFSRVLSKHYNDSGSSDDDFY